MLELECRVWLQDPEGAKPAGAAEKCASADRGLWLGAGLWFWLGELIAANLRLQRAGSKRKSSRSRE
jgi:hypothetical protein